MRAIAAITFLGVLSVTRVAGADERPAVDLKPLFGKVEALVKKHYPKATATLKEQTIAFAFNTREFWIHEPLLTGEWQDAYKDIGPQKGGIWGEIAFVPGEYGGMAADPQSFDKRYFTTLLLAPHSKKLDAHLHVLMKYPREAPAAFLKEFEELMSEFDKHVK